MSVFDNADQLLPGITCITRSSERVNFQGSGNAWLRVDDTLSTTH